MCEMSRVSNELKPKIKQLIDTLKTAEDMDLDVHVVNRDSLKLIITALELYFGFLDYLSGNR